MKRAPYQQRGFFLIEVIVASAVIGTALIFLVGSIQDSVEVSQRALERTQAAYLLEEGVEVVKAVRDQNNGWDTITNLSTSTTYYPTWTGAAWTLSATPVTVGKFTRTVTKTAVTRNSDQDIDMIGTVDPGTMKFTTTVTWQSPSGQKSEALSFYVSNISE
jgi:Tfp pilus assembly protein PilV